MPNVLLSLGSNTSSITLNSVGLLTFGLDELKRAGQMQLSVSSLYSSPAVGPGYQPDFYNAAALIKTSLPPLKLLKLIKQIEHAAGRRGALFWGPRPLDIDIIDYDGQVLNWRRSHGHGSALVPGATAGWRALGQGKVRPLTLPHGEMQRRVFVLKPVAEIAHKWRHPLFKLDANHLMALCCSPLAIRATEKLEKFWQV
jgi:2-amino-4-hydroxy-6-hydroxymethyldihydropteridine diphosphokinase